MFGLKMTNLIGRKLQGKYRDWEQLQSFFQLKTPVSLRSLQVVYGAQPAKKKQHATVHRSRKITLTFHGHTIACPRTVGPTVERADNM